MFAKDTKPLSERPFDYSLGDALDLGDVLDLAGFHATIFRLEFQILAPDGDEEDSMDSGRARKSSGGSRKDWPAEATTR